MAFPGHPEDESAYAKSAAAHTGVRYVESSITAATIWNQLREFIHFQDGPTGGASTFASWQVFKAARADGTTVLLSGQGGDELFAGTISFSCSGLRRCWLVVAWCASVRQLRAIFTEMA